ncbi:NAD(P)H-dependent glycerol-3-phosphate dehydrogenase [Limosilactobacillus mucosae]|jgi:glycerol-3-phosphate dehydrogenase (NAD(P)+)|uniref:NAD(P)H-dependent glycerol-3-phosphate dehydrogenase n=1 Tax=Limosilactobacillus mucosae TaxID=97478 RepID=UPI000FEEC3B9|nr:NAD(P)H-dependent glycerol-3-phosphate dehydrogenase [Limosilactobacillus mucosae]MCI1489146.1 NAD(P)H-dependent glycerol-3-phosphate dehydrogenase [Limosilactobacillus mucosae]MCI1526142.1 NAD(P)H-dependent glycerol-3-phosphate dehydrogenase [Limosilactobacillus mucosae]QLI93775.1 NAD(P)H-dependent glycerol-3-phosphate dehydrogenase [Limosilactobacillus mucosae]RRG06031.1 MAG: NAD(P)H-dependent glycerol-3-phosphate dehydrogenase [Lactobacillus sp.]
MSNKIAVLGAGSWGSVLANLLVGNNEEVMLWSRDSEQVVTMNRWHINPQYMKDFKYSPDLKATDDMEEAVRDAEYILMVIPTKGLREVAGNLNKILVKLDQKPLLIHATKGLEQETYKRPSQMLAEEIDEDHRQDIVVLSGPSHAEDVAIQDMTAVTAACANLAAAERVQKLFSNNFFRVYTNDDVIGAEFGGALKNIIAIGAGALQGLGYKDNARAALITRGLAEIRRLGVAFGANPFTFIGLSGVGDLVVTATSKNSRNWRAGYQLGQGRQLEDVISNMGMVIEGIYTAKAAYELAQKRNVKMPITEALYRVLYEGEDIETAITNLMSRKATSEME